MKIAGIITQDGTRTVEEISKLQLIAFKHTSLDGSRRCGYLLRAFPTNDTLGEFVDLNEAMAARDKIADKVKIFGKNAFVIVPEDKTAARLAREACYQ